MRRLKTLLARLQTLEGDYSAGEKSSGEGANQSGREIVEESIHTVLAGLEREKERLEKMIDEHIDSDP